MQRLNGWLAFVEGRWWTWNPLPGLDPGLGENACRIAAAKWATCMAAGKPEAVAHQEAEQLAFETVYGASYGSALSRKMAGKHQNR